MRIIEFISKRFASVRPLTLPAMFSGKFAITLYERILNFWQFSDRQHPVSGIRHPKSSKCCSNCLKDSDASEMVIEVLCKRFCRRLPFVYNSYDVDRGFQVSGRDCQCHRRQGRRDVVD